MYFCSIANRPVSMDDPRRMPEEVKRVLSVCVCACVVCVVSTYGNSKGSHIDAQFPVLFKFLISPQTVKYIDIRSTYKRI